jgi:methylenetetrahydrofolate--tRNA-(uracil-5-)-methyltransferase
MTNKVIVAGAGLAGSEAAWQIAKRGIPVVLKEMKPVKFSEAHKNPDFAELVCSNSLRSDDISSSAVGVLHEELRRCGSLLMQAADATKVPAGAALAVDREGFSAFVKEKIKSSPLIEVQTEEVTALPLDANCPVIIATGPLTSEPLSKNIEKVVGAEGLHFFDAIAPVVYAESVDMNKAWRQSRWDKDESGQGDYINCPLSEEEYYEFVRDLLEAEKMEFTEWEKQTPYFDGCLPIEVMAERGKDTLAFGPMKPVGLYNPHKNGEKEFAVVQLRNDNASGTLLNMVGFQTKMKWGEQKRIFRKIRGLENAEFARLGSVHRNTFINSPKLLTETLVLKSHQNIRFAGQITGCEGYVESIAIGFLTGLFAAEEVLGKEYTLPPEATAMGSMLRHVVKGNAEGLPFQPSNINFGLFPNPDIIPNVKKQPKGKAKKELQAKKALDEIDLWRKQIA